MEYKIEFNIYFDGEEEPSSEKELKNMIEDMLESSAISVSKFKLLEVVK